VKVPKSLPLELLAPLGCRLQTGAGTVMNSLAVRAESSIAVFGAGSVGLAAVMAARILKGKTIIAVDMNDWRLKLARELGATHAINNRRNDLAASIKAITGSGVDYVVESTANHDMEQLAGELLNPGGKAALLSGASAPGKLPGERQVLSVIQGDAVPQKFIPKLIKLHQEGRFPFDRLVKFYDLDIRQLAEVLVVLTIATFTFLNPARALHKFNRLNPFHHFETELVFNPEPQGCAVEFA